MTMGEMAPHKGQAFAYSRLFEDGPGALPAAMCEIRSIVERFDPSGGEGVHPAAKNCKAGLGYSASSWARLIVQSDSSVPGIGREKSFSSAGTS